MYGTAVKIYVYLFGGVYMYIGHRLNLVHGFVPQSVRALGQPSQGSTVQS